MKKRKESKTEQAYLEIKIGVAKIRKF